MPPSEIDHVLDVDALAVWMGERDGRDDVVVNARRLDGGTQNFMLMFERAGRTYVLRQPPAHALYPPAKMVDRETRVVRALFDSDVPVPPIFGVSSGKAGKFPPFYVMDAVSGFTATQGIPFAIAGDPSLQHRMGLGCIEALVALSRFDHVAAGLADLGKPEHYLTRQVERWKSQLKGYDRFADWQLEGPFRHLAAIEDWLSSHVPQTQLTGLLHGDFHLGNILFDPDDAGVVAIIDWELATIGDPLIDLGWLLATWPTRDGASTGAGIAVPGATDLPSPRVLVEHFEAVSGVAVGASITWYVALACYKLAIIQEGSWARCRAGLIDPDIGKRQHERALAMIGRALALADDQSSLVA